MNRAKTQTVMLPREKVYEGPLVLVNRQNPLHWPVKQETLVSVAPGVLLEKQAARLFQTLLESLGAGGQIMPTSGHRTRARQAALYAECLAENGQAYTDAYVALPGHSEHETGLAVDVGLVGAQEEAIAPAFPYEGICQRFRTASVQHGFIQRYQPGKEAITGIAHEPWHFRYVGFPHSALMGAFAFSLEEYLQWIRAFPFGRRSYQYALGRQHFSIGYVPAGELQTEILIDGAPYTLSGNNSDGFVVAVWGAHP